MSCSGKGRLLIQNFSRKDSLHVQVDLDGTRIFDGRVGKAFNSLDKLESEFAIQSRESRVTVTIPELNLMAADSILGPVKQILVVLSTQTRFNPAADAKDSMVVRKEGVSIYLFEDLPMANGKR
jgi:hypothetical protein